jgi:ParB family transcriptional regulator, chromosome partitioning protein
MQPRRSLGRGLSDLLSGTNAVSTRAIIEVEVEQLQPNPFQPRRQISEGSLAELADSIREQGVLQPIIVRESADGYQIVAGERRWRAVKQLDLRTIPCVISDFNDLQMLEIALIENLQRDDLNPIDEARAYKRLSEEFGLSQDDLATRVGKSRPAVANCMRLLSLPLEVQDAVSEGTLTEGHARALLALRSEPGLLYRVCEQTIREGLSVRQTEETARKLSESSSAPRKEPGGAARQDPHLSALLERLQGALATKVAITPKSDGGGTIRIAYHDAEELTRLMESIAPEVDF